MITDGAYPSLLQGVSQQIVQNRIEGQLTEQTNMLSDIVTGLRRRPGSVYRQKWTAETLDSLHSTYLEMGNTGYHLFVNPLDGCIKVYDMNYALVFEKVEPYLIASSVSSIHTVTQSGYTWFLNTEELPVLGAVDATTLNPDNIGWFSVMTGAYSKAYTVTISTEGFSKNYSYSTPGGATEGDVGKSVPDYIADQIVVKMNADTDFTARFEAYPEGPYVFIRKKDTWTGAYSNLKVGTSTGTLYLRASNTMIVPLTTDLPANLPTQANGATMTIGNSPITYSYFRWFDEDGAWKEVGSYDSASTITNMPTRLKIVDNVFTYDAPEFEGRLAGNGDNNPYSAFVAFGITGMSAYQGRLILLAGGYCCMSASDRPLRFMRSTLSDLRDDDPIEISAGALAAASFEYAIPFNKDLMLISASHQAVIPAGTTGITPKNALVVLSTTESICTNSEPTVMGRTLMYGTSISKELFGAGEMIPSQYTNSQYSSNNLTAHIPRYVSGQCRSITSNSGNSTGYFLSTGELNSILINEFLWAGDERLQNAWSKWIFSHPILSIHSAKGTLIITYRVGAEVVICSLDTRTAKYQREGYVPEFVDMLVYTPVVDNKFVLPEHLQYAGIEDVVLLAHGDGSLAGEPIGIESIDPTTWEVTTVRSFEAGMVIVGIKYTSEVTPSTALIRDKDGVPILTANTNILRYLVNVQNTGEFNVKTVIVGYDNTEESGSALLWSSAELGLGRKQTVNYGTVKVPVRAYSFDTDTTLSADGTRELNIVSIEYTLRGVLKRKRS